MRTNELSSRKIYEGLKKAGYECDLDIWMKTPEWARVQIFQDGKTWTIEGVDAIGEGIASQTKFSNDLYIHIQIEKVFKKEEDASVENIIRRLHRSFIQSDNSAPVNNDGSSVVLFYRQYPVIADDEIGIDTVIKQFNNFTVSIQSAFASAQ